VAEQLAESGDLLGEPRPIQHPVKFYEKGDRPLEIVASRQWYIRNGGRERGLRSEMVGRGAELTWHPDHMRHRYDNWVEGLNGDWLISRQRFFGVPIPVWYPLDEFGEPDFDSPLLPSEDLLPIDPTTDVPDGYTADQRDQAGGFTADPDIFDTWATSSLTPQIAGHWEEDDGLFDRVFPMDMRPQAHDIIRTWLFSTVVRSHYEFGCAPWTHAALSGWILDPDRKKMSKSKGNVVTPIDLFERYGTDAVRYWASSARPGVDAAFSEDQMKVGRKLANKLLNVSKFVLGFGDVEEADDLSVVVTNPVDLSMLATVDEVVEEATAAFEGFDYARALERTEAVFWWFCDNYVELVKSRAYGDDDAEGTISARQALRSALSTLQRLLAPIQPFATAESWSWWNDDSVHRAEWPRRTGLGGDPALAGPVIDVLTNVRRAKTEAKRSQRSAVDKVVVTAPDGTAEAAIRAGVADLTEAGSIADLTVETGDSFAVLVELAAE
jgi:valyl-tRNA synthetase